MSLITDAEWILQQLRIDFLRSEDALAERLITFAGHSYATGGDVTGGSETPKTASTSNIHTTTTTTTNGAITNSAINTTTTPTINHNNNNSTTMINSHNSQQFLYVQDAFPERSLCYSPNLQHILSELGKNGRLRSNNNGSNKSQANLKKSIDELGSVTKKESAQNNAQKKMIVKPRNDVTVTLDFVREPIPNTTISNNSTVSTSTSTKSISVLAQKLLTSGQSENAFGKDYSFVCGKGVPNPIHLKIFFPSSQDPKKPLPVIVKRDATVEQVIVESSIN